MSEFLSLAERLAPTLLVLMARPYWVSVCHPPGRPGVPRPEPALEFWVGPFDNWYPVDNCMAIFAVTPATVLAGRRTRRSHRPNGRAKGLLVCAVSREGEAYCAMTQAGGDLLEGTPNGGLLLDFLRSKFGLPPGPSSPYDLAVTVEP